MNERGIEGIPTVIDWAIASIRTDTWMVGHAVEVGTPPMPVDFPYPGIMVTVTPMDPMTGNEGEPVMSVLHVHILAVSKGSLDITETQPIARRIREMFHKAYSTASVQREYGTISDCSWKKEVYYDDRDKDDQVEIYLGHTFEVHVQ